MQVRILKDIFNQASNNDDLNNLLVFFRQARHSLLLENADDIEGFNNSIWKKELNSRDVKVIERYILTSARREKNKPTISVSNTNSQTNFSPNEAYLYLNQPLIVLIENSEYDSPFINAIIRNFDVNKINLEVTLEEAKKEIWWKYGMSAGSSIEQVINGELQNSFDNSSFTKPKEKYLRYFVIMDSDKKYPEMSVQESKYKSLKDRNLPFHILYKREKENYMPDNILLKFNDVYLNLFCAFRPEDKKDFFDLEKGFENKNKSDKNWDEKIKEFFEVDNIKEDDWKILRKGIPIEEYKKSKFKTEFSKLFNNATQEAMTQRIAHQPKDEQNRNEFEQIVAKIKNLL